MIERLRAFIEKLAAPQSAILTVHSPDGSIEGRWYKFRANNSFVVIIEEQSITTTTGTSTVRTTILREEHQNEEHQIPATVYECDEVQETHDELLPRRSVFCDPRLQCFRIINQFFGPSCYRPTDTMSLDTWEPFPYLSIRGGLANRRFLHHRYPVRSSLPFEFIPQSQFTPFEIASWYWIEPVLPIPRGVSYEPYQARYKFEYQRRWLARMLYQDLMLHGPGIIPLYRFFPDYGLFNPSYAPSLISLDDDFLININSGADNIISNVIAQRTFEIIRNLDKNPILRERRNCEKL